MNGLMRLACIAGILLIVTGCGTVSSSQYQSWQFERAVEEVARSSRASSSPATPGAAARVTKPATASPKTTESTKEYDERHPSRWKRKLKAAYA